VEAATSGKGKTVKKIISLFQRNYDGDRLVRDEVVPGAEWVIAGEGVATIKWDGTSCLIRDDRLFKRYDVKGAGQPPPGFEPAQDPDAVTGHWPGWLPVGPGPEDRWHREAWGAYLRCPVSSATGTYELVGPKVNRNPHRYDTHTLLPHGDAVLLDAPRTYVELREYLRSGRIEGIVWWNPAPGSDAHIRAVKIKARDFGWRWPEATTRK
jgi:uncharacterized protein DUF5565